MYQTICVPVDSSPRSRKAAILAERFSQAFEGSVTGLSIDTNQSTQNRLSKLQSLLSADSNISVDDPSADATPPLVDVPFDAKVLNGRPHVALLNDIEESEYELVVLGATRANEPQELHVGTACERMIRRLRVDTLVVKEPDRATTDESDVILVCMDGSKQAFGGLLTAFELAQKFNKRIEAVAVYDPYLHYTLFNGIVGVLSEQASSVFKFKDQEKLHEEIIDTGLAKIYQAHLEIAREIAKRENVDLKITLLDGKAFSKILRHANMVKPWLMILGRIGVHSTDEMDVGATTENLLRTVPCDVLISSRTHVPPVDIEAKANIEWSDDALQKMERVPSFVKGVATNAIMRWAKERGHSIITASVINSAMGDLLPPGAAQAMGYIAEDVAVNKDRLFEGKTFICPECGHAVKDIQPAVCIICQTDGDKFQMIDRAALESAGSLDRGDLEEEETFDGKKLKWTSGAKEILRRVPSGYDRRRSKARIEKTARVRGLNTITDEFAIDMVEQDMADTAYLTPRGETVNIEITKDERADDHEFRPREASDFQWTDAAWTRMCRVPAGFMRDMTRQKVEQYASDQKVVDINLALCESGIAEGRRMMAEALSLYGAETQPEATEEKTPAAAEVEAAEPAAGKCPMGHVSAEQPTDAQTVVTAEATPEAAAGKCPVAHDEMGSKEVPVATAPGGTEDQITCPMSDSGVEWSDEAKSALVKATKKMVASGKFEEQRAADLASNVAETRAREKRMEQIGAAFMGKLGKQLGYGHPLSEQTSEHEFEWTAEALEQLENVPEFCRELTKWRVEWTAVKKDLGTVITPEIMKLKYDMWGEVSDAIMEREGESMEWDAEAKSRVVNIPEFVKGQVVQSIEGNAKLWGYERVTEEVMDKVIQKWIDTGDFHEAKYGYK